jgi:hypothetical protein
MHFPVSLKPAISHPGTLPIAAFVADRRAFHPVATMAPPQPHRVYGNPNQNGIRTFSDFAGLLISGYHKMDFGISQNGRKK